MIERKTADVFEAQIEALLARPDARPSLKRIRRGFDSAQLVTEAVPEAVERLPSLHRYFSRQEVIAETFQRV